MQTTLLRRISKNVADWNLDGVDFYFDGPQEGQFWVPPSDNECCVYPGNSALYHLAVITNVRKYLPSSKTISYTTAHDVDFKCEIFSENYYDCSSIMKAVILAAHPYLDWISFKVIKNKFQKVHFHCILRQYRNQTRKIEDTL